MKPLRLEFSGINSFSSPAVVDFENLLKGGVFGIFGDTGAGKSTILDSIGFALYGRVNRLGKEGTLLTDAINYNSQKIEVAFDFEVEYAGERTAYRIERTLGRKNNSHKAILYKKTDGKLLTVADGLKAVGGIIEKDIIGISFDDFKKCIALPQGEFAQFLKASRGERLALIAKLFSFERYGAPLAKNVRMKRAEKNQGVAEIKSKLETYQDVSVQIVTDLESNLRDTSARLNERENEARESERVLEWLSERVKNQNDLREVEEKLKTLRAQSEEMREKSLVVEKLRVAKEVMGLKRDLDVKQTEYAQKKTKANGYVLQTEELKIKLQSKENLLNDLKADGRVQSLQTDLARVEAAQADVQSYRQAQKRLEDARLDYKRQCECVKAYGAFDYEGQKAVIEGRKALLPKEDNVNDFIRNNLKDVMLAEEYQKFALELAILTKKYPQIGEDTQPLIDRYSLKTSEGMVDIAAQIQGFTAASRQKHELDEKLLQLEKRNNEYQLEIKKLQDLEADGRRLATEVTAKQTTLAEVEKLGSSQEIKDKIEKLLGEQKKLEEDCNKIKDQQTANEREYVANQAGMEELSNFIAQTREKLTILLNEYAIESVDVANALLVRYGDPERIKKAVDDYNLEWGVANRARERLIAVTQGEQVSEESLRLAKDKNTALKLEISKLTGEVAVLNSNVEKAKVRLQEKEQLEGQSSTQMQELAMLDRVLSLVADGKFMEFIAVEYLQDMAAGANNLLLNLTNGRYFLVYDKNFAVGDNFNGGALRGVHTLSGGETFLVSLALALSLSAAIHQKSLRPIEFFFLDEGFGSLDGELVDTVMDSLEKLKSDNFSIGIISHVGELKDRLENKISVVKADGEHGSLIKDY